LIVHLRSRLEARQAASSAAAKALEELLL
jgi:hypothetical protein